MSLIEYAQKELELAGAFDSDDYDGELGRAVMELIRVFSGQEHSGMSASLVLAGFMRLASFTPWSPLTGDDDEWLDRSECEGGRVAYQNTRCPYVFKDSDGAYYFDKDNQRVAVEFPFEVPDNIC